MESEMSRMSDLNIDFSGPELKQAISIRLDLDTIIWFKKKYPRGYQTAMNLALKKYIQLVERESNE
jgi:uncharacterized protein (DUF4415 family)